MHKTVKERILEFVSKTPGKTQIDIAREIFGPDGYRQQVHQDVRRCIRYGLLRKEGLGGRRDPYRYYPTDREFHTPRPDTGDGANPDGEAAPASRKDLTVKQRRIVEFVSKTPGKTQRDIAEGIHGPDAVQPQVNKDVRDCVCLGFLREEGRGGTGDPYRYYHPSYIPRSDTGDGANPDGEAGSASGKYPPIRQRRIVEFVSKTPGKTQCDIAKELFGKDKVQARVHKCVRDCVRLGDLREEGRGVKGDLYRYYPKDRA